MEIGKNSITCLMGLLRESNEKMHLKCLAWDLPQSASKWELLRHTVFALVVIILALEALSLSRSYLDGSDSQAMT